MVYNPATLFPGHMHETHTMCTGKSRAGFERTTWGAPMPYANHPILTPYSSLLIPRFGFFEYFSYLYFLNLLPTGCYFLLIGMVFS